MVIRHIEIMRKKIYCHYFMGYSFQLAARDILNVSSQDSKKDRMAHTMAFVTHWNEKWPNGSTRYDWSSDPLNYGNSDEKNKVNFLTFLLALKLHWYLVCLLRVLLILMLTLKLKGQHCRFIHLFIKIYLLTAIKLSSLDLVIYHQVASIV